MKSIAFAIPFLFCLTSCEIQEKEKERWTYNQPTGLMMWLIIISFAIAVISALYLIVAEKTDPIKRGTVSSVGIVFLLVTLLLLTSGC